jgi:hypothetical protein
MSCGIHKRQVAGRQSETESKAGGRAGFAKHKAEGRNLALTLTLGEHETRICFLDGKYWLLCCGAYLVS